MDFNLSKGPKDDGSFFGRNGTLQEMTNVAGSIRRLQSDSASSRFGGLANIIGMIMSLFG